MPKVSVGDLVTLIAGILTIIVFAGQATDIWSIQETGLSVDLLYVILLVLFLIIPMTYLWRKGVLYKKQRRQAYKDGIEEGIERQVPTFAEFTHTLLDTEFALTKEKPRHAQEFEMPDLMDFSPFDETVEMELLSLHGVPVDLRILRYDQYRNLASEKGFTTSWEIPNASRVNKVISGVCLEGYTYWFVVEAANEIRSGIECRLKVWKVTHKRVKR
ncbi:MAG: hypothetical protein E3J35_08775 [Methanomassiliicoccales archaeon]|nr:MAG: hypothetical protein E3J35_08775 [Methanomassiliicoccales archaeon]